MTSAGNRNLCVAAMLLSVIGLVGCGGEKAPEFCNNHGPFHGQHRDELGSLTVSMHADGQFLSELRLPVAAAGGAESIAILGNVSKVYTVQTANECEPASAAVAVQGSILVANYATSCAAGNKLGQLDVHLFDSLPMLEEIEVFITTPVAEKHFAINRQCENAIFRLR